MGVLRLTAGTPFVILQCIQGLFDHGLGNRYFPAVCIDNGTAAKIGPRRAGLRLLRCPGGGAVARRRRI